MYTGIFCGKFSVLYVQRFDVSLILFGIATAIITVTELNFIWWHFPFVYLFALLIRFGLTKALYIYANDCATSISCLISHFLKTHNFRKPFVSNSHNRYCH